MIKFSEFLENSDDDLERNMAQRNLADRDLDWKTRIRRALGSTMEELEADMKTLEVNIPNNQLVGNVRINVDTLSRMIDGLIR